ncbi:MAG: hypothetical protein AAF992_14805 [Bacteroidota bacterium]
MKNENLLYQQAGEAMFNRLGHSGDMQNDYNNLYKMHMYATRYLSSVQVGMTKDDTQELDNFSCTVENLGIIIQKAMPLKDQYYEEYQKQVKEWESKKVSQSEPAEPQTSEESDSRAINQRYTETIASLADQFADTLPDKDKLILDYHVLTRMKQYASRYIHDLKLRGSDNFEFDEDVFELFTEELTVLLSKLSNLQDEVKQQHQWRDEKIAKFKK